MDVGDVHIEELDLIPVLLEIGVQGRDIDIVSSLDPQRRRLEREGRLELPGVVRVIRPQHCERQVQHQTKLTARFHVQIFEELVVARQFVVAADVPPETETGERTNLKPRVFCPLGLALVGNCKY